MDLFKHKTKYFIKYHDMPQHVSLQPESEDEGCDYIDRVVYSTWK